MLPLNDRVAFHPSLAELKDLFTAGKLAVVEGVGYPNPNYSHFRAMDIWQSADPDGVAKDGWLGRYFDGLTDLDGHPLAGLSVGRSLPSSMEAPKVAVPAIESIGTLRPAGARRRRRTRTRTHQPDAHVRRRTSPANTPVRRPAGHDPGQRLAELQRTCKAADTRLQAGRHLPAELAGQRPASAGGAHRLRQRRRQPAARRPRHPRRLRHAHAARRAPDAPAHGDQRGDSAPSGRTSEAHGHGDDVLVMTWSEFGRRVKENAQNGTDHGSAAPMFVVGGSGQGRLLRRAPPA